MLGVPHTWLLAQAREGRIPHHRLGHYVRFNPEDLKEWLQRRRGVGRRGVGRWVSVVRCLQLRVLTSEFSDQPAHTRFELARR